MSRNELFHSPLHDLHAAAGAAMSSGDGWEMPLHYGDAAAEVKTARESAAVADESHFGRIRFRGDQSGGLLARLCGPEVLRQEDNTVRPVTFGGGGTGGAAAAVGGRAARLLRLEEFWLLVTRPDDRASAIQLATATAAEAGLDADLDDQTQKTVMIAVVGPAGSSRLDAVLPVKVTDLADGGCRVGSVLIARYVALHSDIAAGGGTVGTGAMWRMEVILPNLLAGKAWQFITEKAGPNRIAPIGTEAMAVLTGVR